MNAIDSKFKRLLDNGDFLRQLILQVTLFSDCNNDCSFCFQHRLKKQIHTRAQFIDQFEDVKSTARDAMRDASQFNRIKIGVSGGELLCYSDSFPYVRKFFEYMCTFNAPNVIITLTTNLLYEDDGMSRLLTLINDLRNENVNFKIATSFDFGNLRFKPRMVEWGLDLFMRNFFQLRSILNNDASLLQCGVIRTKEMLTSLKHLDEQFNCFSQIVQCADVSLSELTGQFGFSLTYDESVELWKMIADLFPDLARKSLDKSYSAKNCFNTITRTIAANNIWDGCRCSHGIFIDCDDVSFKHSIINQQLHDYKCVQCAWFEQCSMPRLADRRFNKCDLAPVYEYMNALQH